MLARARSLLLVTAFVALAAGAPAQGHGGGPPGGGMRGGGYGNNPGSNLGNNPGNNLGHNLGGEMGSRQVTRPPVQEERGTLRGGLQLGPPGRWWDDRTFAHTIGIDPSQQHRMDDIFTASKPTLIKLFRSVQYEESQLEKFSRARSPDEVQIFQQIDRVSQARGELEKATAHYLLTIRKEMTQDQLSRLEDHRAPAD